MINAKAEQGTLATRASEVFARYRDGEVEAMAELIAMLTPILWHAVRAQRLDADSTEDVLQNTWFTLVRKADTVADPTAVLQWLLVAARREAWRVGRLQAKQVPSEFADDALKLSPSDLPDNIVLRGVEQEVLWSHVASLPERCRALLRVIAFADRPDYAALARSLGMPVGSIGPTRGRCLDKLRKQLTTDARWELG